MDDDRQTVGRRPSIRTATEDAPPSVGTRERDRPSDLEARRGGTSLVLGEGVRAGRVAACVHPDNDVAWRLAATLLGKGDVDSASSDMMAPGAYSMLDPGCVVREVATAASARAAWARWMRSKYLLA